MRTSVILIAIALGVSVFIGKASAQSIDCGSFYTVERGDTLQKIAQRAYGRGSAYQILHSSNLEQVGRNPGFIRIGAKIWVPCIDGEKATSGTSLSEIGKRASGEVEVKLLTGSDFAPFTDQALPNGGMLTEVVDRAIQAADSDLNYKVAFINDWASHLTPLLSEGAYDMGFPWYKPDCEQYDRLGTDSKWRCDHLLFSEPLYENVVSYFGMKDKNLKASSPSDLRGRTLCRPSGYFKFDLEQRELVAPNVTLLQPASVNECFNRLKAGDVDVVTINVLTADAAIKQLNLTDEVEEYEDLATIETLHVVIPNTHPRGRALLTRINQGLRKIQRSGDYRKVVERHLAEFVK
jgi:polar amino acid transport system substrate-binding protein